MDNSPLVPPTPFETRIQLLQKRVNEAADALHAKGIKPTVQRIRAALGGGSPNDLTPALKHWRDEILPTLQTVESNATGIPSQVADLVRELWTRALAAAEVDRKGGAAAIARIARSEEVQALREQIRMLRDQLEQEAVRYGDLRSQAARYEAIAKDALGRLRAAEERERKSLERLGESNAQLAELRARTRRSTSRHHKAITPRTELLSTDRAKAIGKKNRSRTTGRSRSKPATTAPRSGKRRHR